MLDTGDANYTESHGNLSSVLISLRPHKNNFTRTSEFVTPKDKKSKTTLIASFGIVYRVAA